MPTFEWKDFFSVGHDEIDDQHKQLFAIVNALYEDMKQPGGATEESLRQTIATLCDFTRRHFAAEESLMQSAGYPDFRAHRQTHAYLIRRIEEFEMRMRNGETRLAAEVLPFLVGEWLSSHIAFEDQQYAGYINSHCRGIRGRHLAMQEQYARQWPLPAFAGHRC